MGVSENLGGTLFWCPYNGSYYSGYYIRVPYFRKPPYGIRVARRVEVLHLRCSRVFRLEGEGAGVLRNHGLRPGFRIPGLGFYRLRFSAPMPRISARVQLVGLWFSVAKIVQYTTNHCSNS